MGVTDWFIPGFFGSAAKQEVKRLQSRITDLVTRQTVARVVQNTVAIYPNWDTREITETYCTQDDLYSLIKLLATTSALIPLYPYLKGTKPTDLPENDPVVRLLSDPFANMAPFEGFEAVYSMLYLHGEAILYKERPELGTNAGKPIKLHLLYPEHVQMVVTQTMPQAIVGYNYEVNGTMIYAGIEPNDIIHIKYFNPRFSITGNELRGLSPVRVLMKRLTRMESADAVATAQMQNGGVPGIVYDKGADYDAVEKSGARRANFYKYLSNNANKGAPYFATGEMGYLATGTPLVDLNISEIANIDFKKLCNAYSVSDILFNNDKASTESNVAIQEKRLYTNSVLPNVYRFRDALIRGLLPEFKDKQRGLRCDLSDITPLQEDLQKKMAAYAAAPVMCPNDVREAMGYERSPDPLMEKVYIKTGYAGIDEMEMPEELPETGDYD